MPVFHIPTQFLFLAVILRVFYRHPELPGRFGVGLNHLPHCIECPRAEGWTEAGRETLNEVLKKAMSSWPLKTNVRQMCVAGRGCTEPYPLQQAGVLGTGWQEAVGLQIFPRNTSIVKNSYTSAAPELVPTSPSPGPCFVCPGGLRGCAGIPRVSCESLRVSFHS